MNPNPRNPQPVVTDPPAEVQRARLAMARLEQHLTAVIDPADLCCDLSTLGFAFLALEDLHPPYPPLPLGIDASVHPRADLALAIDSLSALATRGENAVEILRYAYTIRHLRELSRSRHVPVDAAPPTGPADAGR